MLAKEYAAFALSFFLLPPPPVAAPFDHTSWDRVLKAYVNEIGEVDYAALKNYGKDLDAYVEVVGRASPVTRPELFPNRAHELAYWINAYNALTVRGVVDGYPVASIRDLGLLWAFFRKKVYVAGGQTLSLNNIEHDIIRKKYNEPRIHFALVCASISCPRLEREAFTGNDLEPQLDRVARRFVNERRNVTIDTARNEVRLSKIFDWTGRTSSVAEGREARRRRCSNSCGGTCARGTGSRLRSCVVRGSASTTMIGG
jgi:hypothetical protein